MRALLGLAESGLKLEARTHQGALPAPAVGNYFVAMLFAAFLISSATASGCET
jgi:hypothetical protein